MKKFGFLLALVSILVVPTIAQDELTLTVLSTSEHGAFGEGVALYPTSDGGGYLIVSSQGSITFVVYERRGGNAYIGTFRLVETELIDAVSGADGLDVTSFALGEAFPEYQSAVDPEFQVDIMAYSS